MKYLLLKYGLTFSTLLLTSMLLNAQAPTIQFIGDSTQYSYLGESYVDLGATASDSIDGVLTGSITFQSNVDTSARGIYQVDYEVTNSRGISASTTKRVIVTTEPDADFYFTIGNSSSDSIKFDLTEACLYNPTEWLWEINGDTVSFLPNPTVTVVAQASYNICLTATSLYNRPPFNKPAGKVCKLPSSIREESTPSVIRINSDEASNTYTIMWPQELKEVKMNLSNLSGRQVKDIEIDNNSAHLNTALLPDAMYIIQVMHSKGRITQLLQIR